MQQFLNKNKNIRIKVDLNSEIYSKEFSAFRRILRSLQLTLPTLAHQLNIYAHKLPDDPRCQGAYRGRVIPGDDLSISWQILRETCDLISTGDASRHPTEVGKALQGGHLKYFGAALAAQGISRGACLQLHGASATVKRLAGGVVVLFPQHFSLYLGRAHGIQVVQVEDVRPFKQILGNWVSAVSKPFFSSTSVNSKYSYCRIVSKSEKYTIICVARNSNISQTRIIFSTKCSPQCII